MYSTTTSVPFVPKYYNAGLSERLYSGLCSLGRFLGISVEKKKGIESTLSKDGDVLLRRIEMSRSEGYDWRTDAGTFRAFDPSKYRSR